MQACLASCGKALHLHIFLCFFSLCGESLGTRLSGMKCDFKETISMHARFTSHFLLLLIHWGILIITSQSFANTCTPCFY